MRVRYRKILCAVLCMALVLGFSGCSDPGRAGSRGTGQQKGVDAVLQGGIAKAEAEAKEDAQALSGNADATGDTAPDDDVAQDRTGTDTAPDEGTTQDGTGDTIPAAGETIDEPGTADAAPDTPSVTPDGRQTGPNDNAPTPEPSADADATLSLTEGIDVDLTILSANMVYSDVYNMLCEPERYMGKTIRMSGFFTAYDDPTTGNSYYSCIIQDATACCAQGLEFDLAGDPSYPEDYPEVGDDITVTGVFDAYFEGENEYVTLRNASYVID